MKRPRRLQCACCGEGTYGRQYWNHDTGYGLCGKCAVFIASKGHLDELKGYGIPGHHYAKPLTRDVPLGELVWWATLDGHQYVGELREWDNGTAIVRTFDGPDIDCAKDKAVRCD